MVKFSIVIPILNEEKNIIKLTDLLKKKITNKTEYEIIFVDDNSKDKSQILIKKLSQQNKKIKFIFRKNKNRDLSRSCFEGIEKAAYPYILIMDGDLQHNPKYITKMVNLLYKKKLDVVVGSRDFSKINHDKSLSSVRLYASILIKSFIHFFLGFKTNDPLSGFFCFKKKIIYKKKLFGKGYKILADILYSSNNLKVSDVTIKFDHRKKGKSKMSIKVLLLILLFITSKFINKIIS